MQHHNVVVEGELSAKGLVSTDVIAERTEGVGVTIDGLLIKDGALVPPPVAAVPDPLEVDNITERTLNAGVTVDVPFTVTDTTQSTDLMSGAIITAGGLAVTMDTHCGGEVHCSSLSVDNHKLVLDTGGNLRNIDANNDLVLTSTNIAKRVCLQVGAPANSQLAVNNAYIESDVEFRADTIREATGNAGVDVDSVLLKDSTLSFDGGTNALATIVNASSTSGTSNPTDATNITGLGAPTITQSHRIGDLIVLQAKFSISVTSGATLTSFTFDLSTEPSWAQSNQDRALLGHAAVTASSDSSARAYIPVMWQKVNGGSQTYAIVEWTSVATGATDVYVNLNYIA